MDSAPDMLPELRDFFASWPSTLSCESPASVEFVGGEEVWDGGAEIAPNWKGDLLSSKAEEEPKVNGDEEAALDAKPVVPEMLPLVPLLAVG